MREKLKSLIDSSGKMFRKEYVEKHHNEIFDEIEKFTLENSLNDLPFKQQVYHYLHEIIDFKYCKVCKKSVKFINSTIGYQDYCCKKCISIDPELLERKQKTCLERYGFKHHSSNSDVKEKRRKTFQDRYNCDTALQYEEFLIKSRNTCNENHGVYFPLQNDEIKEKMILTTIERYGVRNINKLKEFREKIEKTNIERYGFKSPLQNGEILNKVKKTNIEKYGFECSLLNGRVKEKSYKTMLSRYKVKYALNNLTILHKFYTTMKEKYDVEHALQNNILLEKQKNTCLERYGVDNVFKCDKIKQKIKNTNLNRYGVENPIQNEEIFYKNRYNSLCRKKHVCGLFFQGSYEKDFLDRYSDKIKIERGKAIKYDDSKIYYCDYFLPEYNLHVEMKSSYWYFEYEEKNILKHNECLRLGLEHIFLIDKNYENFDKIINERKIQRKY
jgi:hypothetical protein